MMIICNSITTLKKNEKENSNLVKMMEKIQQKSSKKFVLSSTLYYFKIFITRTFRILFKKMNAKIKTSKYPKDLENPEFSV